MKTKSIGIRLLGLLFITFILSLTEGCAKPLHRATGPIDQEAYIWQRNWDNEIGSSIRYADLITGGFVVLGEEISFDDRKPGVVTINLDYDVLKESGKPIGVALRIGPYSGPFEKDDEIAKLIIDSAKRLITDAENSGLTLNELQIDFDCAESKLKGYQIWLDAIRENIGTIPLTIAILPSWLGSPDFGKLIKSTDGFVLQVHSLEPPVNINESFTLCDTGKSAEWIEQASKFGLPFRVALPTYGYLMAFDKDGKFIGLSAEGQKRSWPRDVQLKEVRSNPNEIADFVSEIQSDRPSNLEGIIWYRMPVGSDRLNWLWPTLNAVIAGRHPESSFKPEARKGESGLVDIVLVNDGETELIPDLEITVTWDNADLLAYDVLNGFSAEGLKPESAGGVIFRTVESPIAMRLEPGESIPIGWLRFQNDTDVKIDVSQKQQNSIR